MIHGLIWVRCKRCFCSQCLDQLMLRLREAKQIYCDSVTVAHCYPALSPRWSLVLYKQRATFPRCSQVLSCIVLIFYFVIERW